MAAVLELPHGGLVLPADAVHRRRRPPPRSRRSRSSARCVVLMTFRTPAEAVELANNTRYGLAASVWTENINLALDIAPKLKAGMVWINCTNVFDAASGFGGYRESGFGREGGREGLWEYVKPAAGGESANGATGLGHGTTTRRTRAAVTAAGESPRPRRASDRLPAIDRTPKLYIGGKQARPDSGYSRPVLDAGGRAIGEVGARQPQGHPQRRRGGAQGGGLGAGDGAQPRADAVLHRREPRGARRRVRRAGSRSWPATALASAEREVDARDRADVHLRRLGRQVRRRGAPHAVPQRHARDARADRRDRRRLPRRAAPLLGFVSTVLPAIAMGNTRGRGPVRARRRSRPPTSTRCSIPRTCPAAWSTSSPACATSWRRCSPRTTTWMGSGTSAPATGGAMVERLSAGNMKRTWVDYGRARDWARPAARRGRGVPASTRPR